MRSAGRSSRRIARQIAAVSVGHRQFEARGELQRAQHAQGVVRERAGSTTRSRRASRSSRPLKGSTYSPVSGSHADRVDGEVAAPRGLLEGHRRVAAHLEALVAPPGLRLAAGQGHVDRAELVDGKGLADRFDAPERRQQRAQVVLGIPNTSRSRSFDVMPRSRSRTKPPTANARPPCAATALATRRASSTRAGAAGDSDIATSLSNSACGMGIGAESRSPVSPESR
jgi:hypothetical protein